MFSDEGNILIKDAIKMPIISGFTISLGNVINEYLKILLTMDSLELLQQVSWQSSFFSLMLYCLSYIWTNVPDSNPVRRAMIGLIMATTGPNRPYVTIILSTPVWGVDSKKEVIAPLPVAMSIALSKGFQMS